MTYLHSKIMQTIESLWVSMGRTGLNSGPACTLASQHSSRIVAASDSGMQASPACALCPLSVVHPCINLMQHLSGLHESCSKESTGILSAHQILGCSTSTSMLPLFIFCPQPGYACWQRKGLGDFQQYSFGIFCFFGGSLFRVHVNCRTVPLKLIFRRASQHRS